MATDHEMREWARANGHEVGERGRLPEKVITAYEAAHTGRCLECDQYNGHRVWCTRYVSPAPEWLPMAPPAPPAPVPEYVADIPAEVVIPATAHETAVQPTADVNADFASLVARIAATAVSEVPAAIDEATVRAIAEEAAINAVAELTQPKVYAITVKDRPTFTFAEGRLVHKEFENVLKLISRGLNVYLVGPPGTGKSTIVEQVAEVLGVPFAALPCGPTTPESAIFGFIDANGVYRGRDFRKVTEFGGVYVFEELDNGHPGIVTTVNVALANGHCPFPDVDVKKHADSYYVATGNTYGTGATRKHVGRNQLDAATLDRFVVWYVGIDEDIESATALAQIEDKVKGAEWIAKIRQWRRNVEAAKLDEIISPRAAINGCAVLDLGFSVDQAAEACVWKGMAADIRAKIERGY